MPLLKTGQATHSQGPYNVNIAYVFILLARPWSPYNYKTLATFKSMVVLISGLFQTIAFLRREEREGAFEKTQSYYEVSSNYIAQPK